MVSLVIGWQMGNSNKISGYQLLITRILTMCSKENKKTQEAESCEGQD